MKRRRMLSLAAMAMATCLGFGARADTTTITYDANLVAPGWYDGTGNPNGGFTVATTDSGIELGLRAKLRQNPNVIDSPTDLYVVPHGFQTNPTDTHPPHAAWNYEFSINLGGSGYTLSTIDATLKIEDVTQGKSITVDPLSYWTDDSHSGNVGAQNSENPLFADFPLNSVPGYTYDPDALDLYEFTLTVSDATTHDVLAQDVMDVQVAPLPSVAWAGLGLIGAVAAAGWMRKRQGQLRLV